MADLVCVDPERIEEAWPLARDMIRSAVRRTNLSHVRDIEDDILNGDALLWLAIDGEKVLAAASTQLTRTEADKVCTVTACGGENMNEWLPVFAQIEAYAKAEGCTVCRIYGRKGWLRVLKDYHMTHVVIERPL